MVRKVVSYIATVTLIWSTWPMAVALPQQAPSDQRSYEEAIERVDRFMILIEEYRSHIDRSQFDLEALLNKLDYDAGKIVRFVENEVHFEQYPGLLRGAQGTLMSRAGNSLDQAVMLATLMKNAGFDARLARGELSPEQARHLLGRMFIPRPSVSRAGDLDAMDRTLSEAKVAMGRTETGLASGESDLYGELDRAMTDALSRARSTSEELQTRLRKAGIALGREDMSMRLIEEARDYYWVEYRLGPGDPWEPVHPANGGAPFPVPEKVGVIEENVPARLQHRVRFEVEIEQQLGTSSIRKKVTSGWERPAANLIGIQLGYSNVPSGIQDLAEFADLRQIAENTEFFLPTFNGGTAPEARAFDLNGVTVPPDVVGPGSFGAGAMVKQIGDKTDDAAAALSSVGNSESAPARGTDQRRLLGQWLVYTLIAPGGGEREVRRTVYRHAEQTQRKSGSSMVSTDDERVDALARLTGVETFMVLSGDYPDAYILDRTLEQILSFRSWWEEIVAAHYGRGSGQPSREALAELRIFPELHLFPVMAAGAPSSKNLVSYPTAPTIVGTWNRISTGQGDNRIESAFDIVSHGRRAFQRMGDRVDAAPEETMLAGVWATEAERLRQSPMPSLTDSKLSGRLGASRMFGEARKAGVPVRLLTPIPGRVTPSLRLPEPMGTTIDEALAQGYTVITPERIAEGMSPGWWRMDPATGETLGMGPEGRGVSAAEHIILSGLVAMYLPMFIFGGSYSVCRVSTDCKPSQCGHVAGKAAYHSILIGAAAWAVATAVTFASAPAWASGGVDAIGIGYDIYHATHESLICS